MWSQIDNYGGSGTKPPRSEGTEALALSRLAALQHGVLTRAQLSAGGLTGRQIEYRVMAGRLYRIHEGVYALGYRSLGPFATACAAALACGPGAVVSHRWAAWLWELIRWPSPPVDITAASKRRHAGIRLHRSRTLTERDVTVQRGIPVTTPARTLLDLAGSGLGDRALARAANEARLRWGMSLEVLAELLDRSPGRATTRLKPFVDRPTAPTRSTLEDAFLAFAQRYKLPRPEVNQHVAGHEVDLLWRAQRLVGELDSRRHHDRDPAFETDRDRDADLLAAGYRVLRITWRRLTDQPDREAERLARLLTRRSPDAPARRRTPAPRRGRTAATRPP